MKRILLLVLAGWLLLFGIWAHKMIWGKPSNLDHLLERYMIHVAMMEPEILTLVGVIDNTPLDFHSHKLSDASPAATYRMLDLNGRYFEQLNKYHRNRLAGQQVVSYDMVLWLLSMSEESRTWAFHDFPMNQTAGVQGTLPDFLGTNHRVTDEKSARNYISRMNAFQTKFDQVRESVLYRASRGVLPPRFTVELVLKDMREFVSPDPSEHAMMATFREKLDGAGTISEAERAELERLALDAMVNSVYPGYGVLIATYEELLDRTREDAGAWTLPDGDEYYRYMTRFHTTLNIEPEDVHEIGLREVERISADMFALFAQIGIHRGSVAERFAELDRRPGIFYEESEGVYERIVADYQSMIDTLYKYTAPLFTRLPKAPVEVRRVPEYSEANAPFAYYNIPALDGSRPGIFFINLRSLEDITTYGMMTLTAHEAVPGHHFQLALAQEMEGVPLIRRLYPFTAYAEGWALYSEMLVSESGLYDDDPQSDLGRLQAEMFRAVRLVVDTGIHLYRWEREKAVQYMLEHTGMPEIDVRAEIDRYVVWPGQALAYKIGMLHIQDLRDRAEKALGEKFSLPHFHEAVLMNGSLPLDVLTTVVDKYIDETYVGQ